MSDQDTKTRFETTSKTCYDAYAAWLANQKDNAARTTLSESIHELRKVLSRLEIEVAVSERKDSRQKPLSAPSHRNAGRPQHQNDDDNSDDDGDNGDDSAPKTIKKRPARRSSESND